MLRKVKKEQLRVPANLDYLSDLRDFVVDTGKRHKIPDQIIKAFKLTIDEAATNIIRYAYADSNDEGTILLRMLIRRESVTVCVIDQGRHFDPTKVENPDLDRYVKIGKKGGLGVHIMRKLMDTIVYQATPEGNELRLTKNRDDAPQFSLIEYLPKPLQELSSSLKARFWARTSTIISILGVLIFLYFFFTIPGDVVRRDILGEMEVVAGQIKRTIEENRSILSDYTGLSQNLVLKPLVEERGRELYEIAVVDSIGRIQGHSNLNKYLLSYKAPGAGSTRQVAPNLTAYTITDSLQHIDLLDYTAPLGAAIYDDGAYTLHIRIHQAYVDQLISQQRWNIARLIGLILIGALAGSFLLIYLLLSPLRKLVKFVTDGEQANIHDHIDIDSSTEVGVLAKAYSDMNDKFKESQRHLADRERLQQEMNVAREIQQTLLPHEFPDIEGIEIAGHYEAAALIGGDYYDFVEIDRDTIGIVVADVSGKGVPGSLVMTMIRQALRTEARGNKNAADVLARLNDMIIGDIRKGMFITMFYAIIDSKRRRLNFASAGHNPMILYRGSTNKTYYLNPKGFPLGIQLAEKDFFRRSIESDTIQLVEGDLVLLYTDGITEAMNSKSELFGEERLLQIIRGGGNLRVKPFVDEMTNRITSFTGGRPQSDDITFVAIREKSSQQKEEYRRAKLAFERIQEGVIVKVACEEAGISPFVYYNKYKKAFETEGVESFELDDSVSLEAKHIAIEDKAKIFDIIRQHPEYGAKRISDELNSETYGFTEISENKIYDELVRSRLNTRQLREAFIARGGRKRARRSFKQPGTPMLTLDGKVITSGDLPDMLQGPKEGAGRREIASTGASRPQPAREVPHRPPAPQPRPAAAKPDDDDVRPERAKPEVRREEPEPKPPRRDERPQPPELADEPVPAAVRPPERSLPENDTPRSAFSFDDLLEEEISRSFSEATSEVSVQFDDGDSSEIIDPEAMISQIDELLNEDALNMEISNIEIEVPVTSQPREKVAEPAPEKAAQPPARKMSVTQREQRMNEGYLHYKNGRYDEAITAFEEVASSFPNYTKVNKILGNAYFRAERYEDALRIYNKVKRDDPQDVAAYENTGIVYLKQERFDEATSEWERLLEIEPGREDIRRKLELFSEKKNQG